MMTCSRVPPWGTPTGLPAGLTGRLIAERLEVQVEELRPEDIGEGLIHTIDSLERYRDPYTPIQTDDEKINNGLTELYRKYPDLVVFGSVDGLGHIGIQSDNGLYLPLVGIRGMLLEPTEESVKSWDGKPATSDAKVDFANRCKDFLIDASAVLGLNFKLVSISELRRSAMQPVSL